MYEIVIIDDEPKAVELLQGYVEKIEDLNCIATFRNPLSALSFVKTTKVHCVIADINMPQISGIEVAKLLPANCKCIFATAHSKFAAESYDLGATDYLLKPISFERFSRAIQKLRQELPLEFLQVKSGYDKVRLRLEDIQYLKKEGNYMIYFTQGKKVLARQSVNDALNSLGQDFIQIHKSYIVKSSKITRITSTRVHLEDIELPLGATFRPQIDLRQGY